MEMGKLLRCISRVRPPANAQVNTVRGQGCCWLVLDGRLAQPSWQVGVYKRVMFCGLPPPSHHHHGAVLPSELLDRLCRFTTCISGYESLSTC